MVIQPTAGHDAERQPDRHDDREHDGAEQLDRPKDEHLPDDGTERKRDEVHVALWVSGDEVEGRRQLSGVHQRRRAEDRAEA
eukprot:2876726-Prorocentrum_lima.AAC.1